MNKPNILLVLWHDLGIHLSCYDAGSVRTPCLDRMAAGGILFENHFSTGGVCVPSRCSILTGRYPHANRLWRFDEAEWALPALLRAGGYHTVRFGFREEREFFPLGQDVDRDAYARDILGYTETREYLRDSAQIADDVCGYLEQYGGEAPLYACVQFSDIHRPNELAVDEDTLACTMPPHILPDLPATRESLMDVASFEERCRRADAAVGMILDFIRDSRRKDNTLVIFSSDHGLDLPRAKLTLYDAATRVAMLCWGAGSTLPGRRITQLTSHVDILPTLLEVAGIPLPEGVEGISLVPCLSGRPCGEHEYILMEKSWESPLTPMRAIRTMRYKYIRNYCPGYPMTIPVDYMKKVGPEAAAIYGAAIPYEQLYDVEADLTEHNNLSGNPAYREILEQLSAVLDKVLAEGGDPILSTAAYMAFLKERFPGGLKENT